MVSSHLYCTTCGAANQAQDAFCSACGRSLRATLLSPQYPVAGSSNNALTGLLPPNLLLKQRYLILGQVGKGGFSAVYMAEDNQFANRLVAVKEMSQSGLSPQAIIEATDAFKQEALMLAGLKHPHLPSIYDHFSEAGRWYFAMDFIEGETLEEHLNNTQGKRLPVGEVLQIGIDLCGVVGYLHTRQPTIIFRDLKPANIILTPEGHLYLIDFGIARLFKPGQSKDTIAFGSPGYAAPEQYGKTQSTPRADIYSLGATLHQLLTGNDPSLTPFQFAPFQLQGQLPLLASNRLSCKCST
jgi:serine/threonine protein kinase